jgi:hypothetical protein
MNKALYYLGVMFVIVWALNHGLRWFMERGETANKANITRRCTQIYGSNMDAALQCVERSR